MADEIFVGRVDLHNRMLSPRRENISRSAMEASEAGGTISSAHTGHVS